MVLIPFVFLWGIFMCAAIFGEDVPNRIGLALGATVAVMVPILAHGFAMRGTSQGKEWGRTLSKVIGFLSLFGFPLWTIIGIMILRQTGEAWEHEGQEVVRKGAWD